MNMYVFVTYMNMLYSIENKNQPSFWLNNEIKSVIYRRDYLQRFTIRNKSESDWNSYKKMRNITLIQSILQVIIASAMWKTYIYVENSKYLTI